jgi:penicillin-binding protein 2
LDRNKKLLVANAPAYDLMVTMKNMSPDMDTSEFCALLGISKEDFSMALQKDFKSGKFSKSVPFPFISKLNPQQFAQLKEHLFKFPGFSTELRSIRTYPDKVGAHVLGYMAEVDQRVIDRYKGEYSLGDYNGVTGIEKKYEETLRGKKGVSYVLKDIHGKKIGAFEEGRLDSAALPGIDIMTTLDLDLQKYAESLFVNKRGSVVAIEPATGEILAMVSSPTYDPNIVGTRVFDSLMNDKANKTIYDRTVKAEYPPGSIFKCLFSLIALQKGIISPYTGRGCGGGYHIGGGKIQKCHAHPYVSNMSAAIQYSCNSYYFDLMRNMVNHYDYRKPGLGLDTLVSYLKDFGLGSKLGVDSPLENNGFIPDSKFYDYRYRREATGWKATYMLSIGIGQGELMLTSVQMANIAAAIANRGFFITPHLVKSFVNSDIKIPQEFTTKKYMRIDRQHYTPVIDGMQMAVKAGTATKAFLDDIEVCGKTGTSENPLGEDHSVFFAFAPKENPKIAIAVFVENAGFGARYAVPIGGLMIEKYLTGKVRESRKHLETRMYESNLLLKPDNSEEP